MPPRGSLLNFLQVGARVSPVESALVCLLPLAVLASPSLFPIARINLICQLALFIPVVQIPAFVTGHMSYVDIGWPCGLVVLAANCCALGQGYWLRKWVVCGCLLLHGVRMAVGALILLFPYKWRADLPRYEYAKVRWEQKDGMPKSLWWLKAQHDTMQQAFANTVVLAVPAMLCATDASTEISALEVAGWLTWITAFAWENVADFQKQRFLRYCREAGRRNPQRKEELRSAVLGFSPFDGPEYGLWARCRHPNYFGEWMCWNGFVLAAVPSLWRLTEGPAVQLALGLTLFFCSRIFYDCLAFWTGAEPAEFFSVRKRPRYTDYQRGTRMFFPFELPGVDHFREPGWPMPPKSN